MQELFQQLGKRLGRGLFREERAGLASDEMREMKNLRPMGVTASTPERIEYPFGVSYPTMDWPFPMVYCGENIQLEFGATSVSSVNTSTWAKSAISSYQAQTPASAFTIVRGGPWQVESFQDLWFASNGATFLWDIPSNSGGKLLGTTALTVQALGKYQNRLVLGGLAGAWFAGDEWQLLIGAWRELSDIDQLTHQDLDHDTRWIVWGEQGGGDTGIPFYLLLTMLGVFGSVAFDAAFGDIYDRLESGQIGLVPVRHPGEIRHVRQLGGKLIAYGSQGVSSLAPNGMAFSETVESRVGIPGRCCVAGTVDKHLWVNNENRTILWPAGAQPSDQGGSAHITGTQALVGRFGSLGFGSGQFVGPLWVAVSDKHVWVSDSTQSNVQAFDHSGTYVSQFSVANAGPVVFYNDELYVLDTAAHQVEVYSTAGALQRSWGSFGTGNSQFVGMGGISVWDGEVYVVDSTRVRVFTTAGTYVRKWGSAGDGESEFNWPKAICAYHDMVWVADTGNFRVQQFTKSGLFIREFGEYGTGDGELDAPVGLCAYDEQVFVVEQNNCRIQVFDDEGNWLKVYGSDGSGTNEFSAPWGICHANGRLYVGDVGNSRTQILDDAMVIDLILSYDPLLDEWWLASQHGSHILTQFGFGQSDQAPTNVFRWGGNRLVGAAVNQEPAERTLRFRTTTLHLGSRDSKKITQVGVLIHGHPHGTPSTMRARVHWRTRLEEWFRHGRWVPVNRQGVGFPMISCNDGQLAFEATYTDSANIDSVEMRYQSQGRVFRRGTGASAQGEG